MAEAQSRHQPQAQQQHVIPHNHATSNAVHVRDVKVQVSVQSLEELYITVFRQFFGHHDVRAACARSFNFQYVFRQPFVLCTKPTGQHFREIREEELKAVDNSQTIFWICQSYAKLENPAACAQLQPLILLGLRQKFHHADIPDSQDKQQMHWPCTFHMRDLASRFDIKNTHEGRTWNPGAGVYPVENPTLTYNGGAFMVPPQQIQFDCRMLCDPMCMDAAVNGQFQFQFKHPGHGPRPPDHIHMESGFDYLEWAFVHLFGQWSPVEQSFSSSYALQEDMESIYQNSGWIPRLLNRAFDTMPHFNRTFHSVTPWSGMGVFWMAARDLKDKKFITLMRQTHALPFAPMPRLQEEQGSTPVGMGHPGYVFAVFQPIDKIHKRILDDFVAIHKERDAWQKDLAAAFTYHPSMRHSRPMAHAAFERLQRSQKCPGSGTPFMNEYGTAASTWKLPASMRNSGTYETGFLVHLVPICRLMEWQYTFFRPYSVPELKFRHENFPRLPPIPSEPQVRGHQVCAAIACDIDLTLINHTLLIQARGVSGAPWPAGLPGLPPNMLIAKDVKKYSDRLYEWVKAHADKLKLAGWYESGTRKEIKEAKWGVTDLKVPVMAALDHVHKHKAIIAGPADGGVRPPVSFEDLDHFFTPGSYNADDPRRCNKQMQHVNVIYPRRDVCAVIAACFPVINGKVVMRYKPVFTTAATQPYGDNVITALKVLVQGWVKNRYKEACYERARALHRDANLAMQQINLFFKGPVMSMQYGRQFGPQSVRDCTDTLLPKMGTGAPLFERENKTATKNFARCLLFGALQFGSTLWDFTSRLTRRAAITLDDSPEAWGDFETELLAYVNRTPRIDNWANTEWQKIVQFQTYIDAFADHGAEVHKEPQAVPGTDNEFHLIPTSQSELGVVGERLTMLHEYATRQHVMNTSSARTRIYPERFPRNAASLDALLPVTRLQFEAHLLAMKCLERTQELANARIEHLKRKVQLLEGGT